MDYIIWTIVVSITYRIIAPFLHGFINGAIIIFIMLPFVQGIVSAWYEDARKYMSSASPVEIGMGLLDMYVSVMWDVIKVFFYPVAFVLGFTSFIVFSITSLILTLIHYKPKRKEG